MKSHIKKYMPITGSVILMFLAFLVVGIGRLFPNMSLMTAIIIYSIIDMGVIAAFIMGIKSKNLPVKIFSIITNLIFFLGLTAFIILMAIANGLSKA